MSMPTKDETDDALDALAEAACAIAIAKQALRTNEWAAEKLDRAMTDVGHARQVASCARDYYKGRLRGSSASTGSDPR